MTKWVKIKGREQLLEDNGDGTYTAWSFGIWGPVGSKGELLPGIDLRHERQSKPVACEG